MNISSTSSPSPNSSRSSPAELIGMIWNAKNASNRQSPPTTPGQDRPRVPQLDRQPECAETQQQHRDLWMRNRAQQPLPQFISTSSTRAPGGAQHLRAPVPPRHRAAVERREQRVEVVDHRSIQRGCRTQRLVLGERLALGDRFLGQLDVPSALARQRTRIGGDIRCRFSAMVSSIGCPVPATGCAAPMWVPGAIAATSAAIVIRNPAEAARAPLGPTKTTTGVRDSMMLVLMSRVASTRPPGVRSTSTTRSAPAASAVSRTCA